MSTKVKMPQGGQDIQIGRVVRWWKAEGEAVKKGETLCEVETEKAVFDVTAPEEGIVLKILAEEGSEVPVFSVIAVLGEQNEPFDLDGLSGKKMPEAVNQPGITTLESPERQTKLPSERARQIEITPKARKLAMDQGISLESIRGSGPGGRIVEKDVLAALEGVTPAPPSSQKGQRGGKAIHLSKQRRVIAKKMAHSKQTVPHFYLSLSVDMSKVVKMRSAFGDHPSNDPGTYPSINDFIVRACALALEEFPEINSSFTDEDTINCWDAIDIGIAIDLPEGMVVQVLEKANKYSLLDLPIHTRALISMAKEGKQTSLSPGRFTISNLGMYNIDSFAAIINPPEAAILAVGSIQRQAVPTDSGQIEIQDRLVLTLSLDHRVGDGVLAARFLNKVRSLLEEPEMLK